MNNTYFFPKFEYKKKDIEFMYIIFDNNDYVSISGKEVVDIEINTYDRLVKHEKGFSPVVANGFIKLNIKDKINFIYNSNKVYNYKDLKNNRKKYIENRCLSESKIKEIYLFDNYSWHKVLLGNIKVQMVNKYLVLEFKPVEAMGGCENEKHHVCLGKLKKEDIFNIELDFENCEGFTIHNNELKEININFKEELEWGSSDINRTIASGYIRIKLNKHFNSRPNTLFNDKKLKLKDFEQRLCGKKGNSHHDICHLYVTYYYTGYGQVSEECIELENISNSEFDGDEFENYIYEAGYCKKLKDGSILIAFGESAKKTIEKFN